MYLTWFRMPKEEFNVYHRMVPYFVLGQLDHSKEVLIPRKHPTTGTAGFEVFNPLYCYEGGRTSFNNIINEKPNVVRIDRSAIIINRGWIPAHLKDKRHRPGVELNTRQLVKVKGVWRAGKNIHDYKYPNNPNNNEWYNLSLEDMGLFWHLPNYDEQKYYYF
jgi:cytochrome oxidase assembly protein ShyY1